MNTENGTTDHQIHIVAWDVNDIDSNNDLVRRRLQILDPDIAILGETMAFVEDTKYLVISNRKIDSINSVSKKGPRGEAKGGVAVIIKIRH